jgi:uncharacterized membrane protein
MTAEKTAVALGWRVYGLGVMAVGMASLVFREFDPGQPVPDGLPAHTVLACAAGALMVAGAAAIEWRRTVAWGAAALMVYYTLFVVILMNGRVLLSDYAIYVTYENLAMQLAIAVAAAIIFASAAGIDAARAARLTRLSQLAFGVCALVFGGAHFVYMNMTAPMVPKWLPPSQVFWGYVTGVCFVAAGLAILTGVQARLAAILLTVMLALFGLLANFPILLADHANHFNWTESAVNLAVVGAAWVVAESLARPSSSQSATA